MTTKYFTSFMNKGRLYALFMIINAVFMSAIFFLGPNQVELLFLFNILASFVMGPLAVLQWTIYTDTADYGEWKFNHRATGLLMAASLFALKVGLALGGALLMWIMDAYGFKANVEQTELSLVGIRMVISIYPAIGALAAGAFMFFYPLTNKKMEEIEGDLQARRDREA
jgi:GPH family glycoside/pentoside/hexuronide:cation symporter